MTICVPNDATQPDVKQTLASAPQRPTRLDFSITNILVTLNFAIFVLVEIDQRVWPQLNILRRGSNFGYLSLNGEWWRLLTSIFIHVSVAHLLANLLFLWILGRRTEQVLGKTVFLLLYLSCALAGNIAGIAYDPELGICGASPAIFGLAGALISWYGFKGLSLSKRALIKLALLILWTAYSIYPDAGTAALSVVAHVAGLVTGLALGDVLASELARREQRRRGLFFGMAILLVLSAILVRQSKGYLIPLGSAVHASALGKTDDALRELTTALQRKPNSIEANLLAAEIYLKKDDYLNADAAAQRAEAGADSMHRDVDRDRATYLLGLVKLHTGYCDQAHQIGDYLAVHSKDDKYKGNNGKEWALSVAKCDEIGSGDRFLLEGRPDLAIGFYNHALRENPNSYRAQVGLAKAYRVKGLQKEADAAAARAAAMQGAAEH